MRQGAFLVNKEVDRTDDLMKSAGFQKSQVLVLCTSIYMMLAWSLWVYVMKIVISPNRYTGRLAVSGCCCLVARWCWVNV